jgi:hypothetical protein
VRADAQCVRASYTPADCTAGCTTDGSAADHGANSSATTYRCSADSGAQDACADSGPNRSRSRR